LDGLPASSLSQARLLAERFHRNHLEGQDGDAVEDGDATALKGKIKDLVERLSSTSSVASSYDLPKLISEWSQGKFGRLQGRKLIREVGKLNTWIIMLDLLELLRK
jgi:hypothetical protein